ncbi:MAG: HEPN domain-containing protein [Spartobacteria bacterium]|nr:HEPN domain-containing protein [Spartobacteria bacterium]
MSVDAQTWFAYADENLAVAELALDNGYFNACLQNAQQAVEKYIKASLIAKNIAIQKTHSIETLNLTLQEAGYTTDLSDEDCDLLDSIYIPSKYPTQSVLPDFDPDQEISQQCVTLAKKVRAALNCGILGI